jgi:hypothetical protein
VTLREAAGPGGRAWAWAWACGMVVAASGPGGVQQGWGSCLERMSIGEWMAMRTRGRLFNLRGALLRFHRAPSSLQTGGGSRPVESSVQQDWVGWGWRVQLCRERPAETPQTAAPTCLKLRCPGLPPSPPSISLTSDRRQGNAQLLARLGAARRRLPSQATAGDGEVAFWASRAQPYAFGDKLLLVCHRHPNSPRSALRQPPFPRSQPTSCPSALVRREADEPPSMDLRSSVRLWADALDTGA